MKLRALLLLLTLSATPLPRHAGAQAAVRTPKASVKTGSNSLGKTVQAILREPAVAQAHWGISVIAPDGSPIYSLNDGQFFEPASNAKLFTTAAVSAVLSPDGRFETQIVARGTLDADGTLHGDIVIEGRGDPSISGRAWPFSDKTERPYPPLQAFEDMADQIAKSGMIHKVTGRVVGDDTWFSYERYGAGWSWDDLQWEYGAPVSALTVNDNVMYLNLMPGTKQGDPPAASWNPPVPYYSLENATSTSGASAKTHLGVERQPGSRTVRLYGTIPLDSKGVHYALSIEDPAEFAAQAFRQMLAERGISVAGEWAAQHNPPLSTAEFIEESRTPLPAALPSQRSLPEAELESSSSAEKLLASHTSPPLGQDLTVVNKVSQNLHAELLLRDLGKAVLNDGSIASGARVVSQFLIQAGVNPGDFLFFDGSGLSSQDLITPRAATTLLAYAARQPWGAAFRATLPIAGIDGTLSGRFTQSPMKGKLWAKTGTLSTVNALSGYLVARSGKTVIISILCNLHNPSGDAPRKAVDKIVEAIYAAN